ncbi:hypothetical protein P6U16_13540 [Rhizobium sp. 32-5/1]|uniref:hypothetical protein n=1 Tax=Rhizobium sp. 32-5/1 TaxID=3019602 RepID=UPI00240E27F4|nr:hypothetical protein [Rhizobium sp. 32-5/1]WEZ82199.1 hypothetical protein P6U16_13540 [Rhizobium sp. 32-5/1]
MMTSLLNLAVAELNAYAAQLAESESEFDRWAVAVGDPKDVAFHLYWMTAASEKRTRAEQLAVAKSMTVYSDIAASVAELLPEEHGKNYSRVGRPRKDMGAWVCAAAVFEAMVTEPTKGAAIVKAAARLGIPDQLDLVEKGHTRILKAASRARSLLGALAKTMLVIDEIEIRQRVAADDEKRERFASRHASPISAERFAAG